MAGSRLALYHSLAKYYDSLYEWKDYRAETARLIALARRWGKPRPQTWLDVACGTGRHLEYLRRSFAVAGVDASAEMLHAARRRLPGVPLTRGDMRTFRSKQRFDVVSCLFSAIAHLPSERDVERAFANLFRALNPGGVAIIEPWIEPSKFRARNVHLTVFDSTTVKVVRLAFSSRRGNRSRILYHYLVAVQGKGIRHFEESDTGLLVGRKELVRRMKRAGFQARFVARGFMRDRGLLVGTKPSDS